MPPQKFNLDGLRMNAPITAPGGVINTETIFRFTQSGSRVEAHYVGGRVVSGSLIGILENDQLEFRYCQLHDDQTLAGGRSECTLERENGLVRIVERYTWANGESGVNIIAQLPDPECS